MFARISIVVGGSVVLLFAADSVGEVAGIAVGVPVVLLFVGAPVGVSVTLLVVVGGRGVGGTLTDGDGVTCPGCSLGELVRLRFVGMFVELLGMVLFGAIVTGNG